jgi:hypothetical protein
MNATTAIHLESTGAATLPASLRPGAVHPTVTEIDALVGVGPTPEHTVGLRIEVAR